MNKWVRLMILPALLIFAIGCGGGSKYNASLSGKVMYGGQPVTGGSMTLHVGDSGFPVVIEPDGSYSAVKLPEGEATATVDNEFLNPNIPTYGGAKGGKGGGMSPVPEGATTGASPGTYRKLPAKYRNKETSDLKVTLKSGKQEKTFELKD